jgi:hypothetical protein
VLHEALDIAHARVRRVAEPHRDLALDVERQPFLGASHHEMHVAAHRPEEILRVAEHFVFGFVEDAPLDQLLGAVHAIDVLRDPEQSVQVAQTALAVLDVRLHQIARLPGAAQPLLALGELGSDELWGRVAHHIFVEAACEFVVERAVAKQVARFQ